MIEINITPDGLREIQNALQNFPEAIEAAINDTKETVHRAIEERSPVGEAGVDPHAGQVKASWTLAESPSGGFSFSTDVDYALILEEGMYERIGPRTMEASTPSGKTGIFSRQTVSGGIGGILEPLIHDETTVDEIVNAVLEELIRGITKHARA